MSAVEIKIPDLGESVSEGVIARWLKKDGEHVETDEPVIELETDKAMLEIPSEAGGRLEILVEEGASVEVGQAIARIHTEEVGEEAPATGAAPEGEPDEAESGGTSEPVTQSDETAGAEEGRKLGRTLSPAVRRLIEEHDIDPEEIEGTGKGGRLTKADVLRHLESDEGLEAPEEDGRKGEEQVPVREEEEVRREPMSQLRLRVAERLVQVQQQAAVLTTFNDIDMSAVMDLRRRYREEYERKHGIRLGIMSLFGRASILALREIPELNAYIDGQEIVYHIPVHLGIAVSTDRGLVVPVVKYADTLKVHELEQEINRLAERARANRITPDELSGGTFSITNGGIFGSLLSTPILNPPQSGILGMHRIEERPVAIEGKVEVRPMMYVALSYDHRIVDGREAVTFLRRVKEYLEDPRRMVIEI